MSHYDRLNKTLDRRINSFLVRKDKQYPELKLLENWGNYEYTPKGKNPGSYKAHKTILVFN